MAILYNLTPYNCGRYEAVGWDTPCAQDEVFTCEDKLVSDWAKVPEQDEVWEDCE